MTSNFGSAEKSQIFRFDKKKQEVKAKKKWALMLNYFAIQLKIRILVVFAFGCYLFEKGRDKEKERFSSVCG